MKRPFAITGVPIDSSEEGMSERRGRGGTCMSAGMCVEGGCVDWFGSVMCMSVCMYLCGWRGEKRPGHGKYRRRPTDYAVQTTHTLSCTS